MQMTIAQWLVSQEQAELDTIKNGIYVEGYESGEPTDYDAVDHYSDQTCWVIDTIQEAWAPLVLA